VPLFLMDKMDPGGSPSVPFSNLCSASILIKPWAQNPSYLLAPCWFHHSSFSLQRNHFLELTWGAPLLNLREKELSRERKRKMIFLANIKWEFMLITFPFLREFNSSINLEP
jgi:hypothetical protein